MIQIFRCKCLFLILLVHHSILIRLHVSSHTWTKESHGLFDYDLKDVMTVEHATTAHTNIIRSDLNVEFSGHETKDLIAKLSNSENRNWWIYH